MPGGDQVGRALERRAQRFVLIGEKFEREFAVEQRIVHLGALQLPVLVLLHQVVVRVARKGERIEPERINHRHIVGAGLRANYFR